MQKIAIVGFGNIGKFALDAVNSAGDMELVGIVSSRSAKELGVSDTISVVSDIEAFGEKPDAAVLCIPSRAVPEYAEKLLKAGIATVDCFDIHTRIIEVRRRLDAAAKLGGVYAVTAAGWDPGSDSIVRALMEAAAPKGITYTNFGPGMSMGHSVAAKAIDGVRDALSMTIPLGTGIHRRMVYVEIEEGYTYEQVSVAIKTDDYFSHDETHVIAVDDINDLKDMGHGVYMVRKGVSGGTHNQILSFDMKINNPALTAQLLIAVARAGAVQKPGCYTMPELPVIDMIEGDKEALIARLV